MSLLHRIEPTKGGRLDGVAKPSARGHATTVAQPSQPVAQPSGPPRKPPTVVAQPSAGDDWESRFALLESELRAQTKRIATLEARLAVLTTSAGPAVADVVKASVAKAPKRDRAAYYRARRAKGKAAQP